MQTVSSTRPFRPPDVPAHLPQRRIASVAMGTRLIVLWALVAGTALADPPTWKPVGPHPTTKGQVEGINEGEVVGAIKVAAPHPVNANIVYVGAVNGGIWMTTNALDSSPHWVSQTDSQKSLSMGALKFDPTDASNQTLVAGLGRFSSLGEGGALTGVLRTTNGGTNWTAIDGGGVLTGLNISGIAPRGATIVLSVNTADNPAGRGIWRTVDAGTTWTQTSGLAGSGLPAGPSYDLVGDPTNPNLLYTNGGTTGLHRSQDTGMTWTKVSTAAMDSLIAAASNLKIAVGRSRNVYVAIIDASSGQVSGVFRSGDGGTTWTRMDLPTNADGTINPGGQGQIHLSIAAVSSQRADCLHRW